MRARPAARRLARRRTTASWRSARTCSCAFMSLGGLQLRGRDHPLRERSSATTSSPRSTSRSTRSRRATPSSAPRRSRATSPTSARSRCATSTRTDHPHRRRGARGRHPGRQDHAQGRDRADGGREAAARDLRREGARGEGHLAARAPRRARQGHRRARLPPRGPRRAAGRRQQAGARLDRPEAQDLRRRQDGRPPRQQGRHRPHPADRGHAVPGGRHARSTSSSTRSACRRA